MPTDQLVKVGALTGRDLRRLRRVFGVRGSDGGYLDLSAMRLILPTLVGMPICGLAGFALGNIGWAFYWLAFASFGAAVALSLVVILITMIWFDPEQVSAHRPVRS